MSLRELRALEGMITVETTVLFDTHGMEDK